MDTEYNEKALLEKLVEAKKNGDRKAIFTIATELLRPEAREALSIIRSKPETTMDNYGEVMRVCSRMGDYRYIFLNALVAEGYNPVTASTIKELI